MEMKKYSKRCERFAYIGMYVCHGHKIYALLQEREIYIYKYLQMDWKAALVSFLHFHRQGCKKKVGNNMEGDR
jgi:hypothetical protein